MKREKTQCEMFLSSTVFASSDIGRQWLVKEIQGKSAKNSTAKSGTEPKVVLLL